MIRSREFAAITMGCVALVEYDEPLCLSCTFANLVRGRAASA